MPENQPPFVVHIDGDMYKVDSPTSSGAQLKALAGRDPSYQLFVETTGNEPDRLIPDTESLILSNGMHFYSVPPATFGH